MIEPLIGFYNRSIDASESRGDLHATADFRKKRWAIFLAITFGYGFYYVGRLSFSIAKKTMADANVFDATQMGVIGSALFFAYAFGKLTNGVLADRVNVRKFMVTGLLVSGIANIALGSASVFWIFMVLWGINGWFQSFGAPSSVVTLSHWYGDKERGSFYGMWSSSHNIGEAITFIGTAIVVSAYGWQWGFRVAGILCVIYCFILWRYLAERPTVYGFPPVSQPDTTSSLSLTSKQIAVFKNKGIWILAFASAFFYVARYAVNSWGVFFLEAEKGYTTTEAGSIVAANAIAGILGTFFSGMLSDRFFSGSRNAPAFIFGSIYVIAIALIVYGPPNAMIDTLSMVLFGLALGVLLVYLGGLMAVDISDKETAGTALGLVGVASYIGAGLQDIFSGILIEDGKQIVDGVAVYNFESAGIMWICSAVISLMFVALVWRISAKSQ